MVSSAVLTPAEKLGSLDWPELSLVGTLMLCSQDWLIVCAGFEDRALAAFKNALATQVPFRVLVIRYRPDLSDNKESEILRACRESGIEFQELIYDRENLAGFGGRLVGELSDCQGRIFLDVSGMSRLLIVQAIVALGGREEGLANCFVLYSEAAIYPPSREEAEAELAKSESDPTFSILFLSSGVYEVAAVPELATLAPAAQTRLIGFPSLDAHHMIALRAELQPSRFSFIEGMPPNQQNEWRAEFISKVNRLGEIRDAEICRTSTLIYQETLRCLLDLYLRHGIHERLLVAPTGSKMQTVAVGIFRTFVLDVQIVYPTPRGFRSPKNYTQGTGPLYLLSLAEFAQGMRREGVSAF